MSDNLLQAYRNLNRSVGIRNHILILPTVFCCSNVVRKIERHFEQTIWGDHGENSVVAVTHGAGCCHSGFDYQVAFSTLLGAGSHPNVGACLIVGLGCGQFCKTYENGTFNLISRLRARGVEVRYLGVQAAGGTEKAIDQGIVLVRELMAVVSPRKRSECDLADITPAILNGGSDPTSGLFSNPTVGHFVDHLIDQGGSAVFSQTSELCGAEDYFLKKCASDTQQGTLSTMIGFYSGMGRALIRDAREGEPTPGNIRSGLSTIAEKSLGNSRKIGHNPKIKIQRILSYALKIPSHSGLYFMEGPGQDLLCLTGMLVGGATISLFTTGMGSPLGHALAPVIKVTANGQTSVKMSANIDVLVNIDEVISNKKTMKDFALSVIKPLFIAVSEGQRTKSEVQGQRDFGIRELWPIL